MIGARSAAAACVAAAHRRAATVTSAGAGCAVLPARGVAGTAAALGKRRAPAKPPPPFAQTAETIRGLAHPDAKISRMLERAVMLLSAHHIVRARDGRKPRARSSAFEFGTQGWGENFRQQVFANNYVNMSNVRAIGFDYDFTLVTYTNRLLQLLYTSAAEYLANEMQYPSRVTAGEYDPKFAVRGVGIDRRHGLLVKLSYRLQVAKDSAYFGRSQVTKEKLEELYGSQRTLSKSDRDEHIKPLLDRFSLAEACLLADTIQLLKDRGIRFDPSAVTADVHDAMQYAHSSGVMHDAVMADLDAYVKPKPQLKSMLESFKRDGKQLFLASNSNFEFVSSGMEFLVGKKWQELFDIVIVSARKPGFYRTDRKFRSADATTGRLNWYTPATKHTPNTVYSGGSIKALQELTGWTGPDVLYFGDHLFADLVEARRAYGWYTGAIINDLERELEVMSSPEYGELAFAVTVMDEMLRLSQDLLYRPVGDEKEGWSQQRGMASEDVVLLSTIENEAKRLRQAMSALYNKRFGSVFQSDYVSTYYGFTMHRYSDLYTSSLMNLAQYSNLANRRFYPPVQRSLPHEPVFPRQAIRSELEK